MTPTPGPPGTDLSLVWWHSTWGTLHLGVLHFSGAFEKDQVSRDRRWEPHASRPHNGVVAGQDPSSRKHLWETPRSFELGNIRTHTHPGTAQKVKLGVECGPPPGMDVVWTPRHCVHVHFYYFYTIIIDKNIKGGGSCSLSFLGSFLSPHLSSWYSCHSYHPHSWTIFYSSVLV